jgi:hypothetical protein
VVNTNVRVAIEYPEPEYRREQNFFEGQARIHVTDKLSMGVPEYISN